MAAQSTFSFSFAALYHFIEPETTRTSGVARTNAAKIKRSLATLTLRERCIPHQYRILSTRFLLAQIREALLGRWLRIIDVLLMSCYADEVGLVATN